MPGNEDVFPFSKGDLAGVRLAYDLVTRADDTPLIAMAKEAGIPSLGGFEMLVEQGAKQFEIWTGDEVPIDVMKERNCRSLPEARRFWPDTAAGSLYGPRSTVSTCLW